jgi:U6 snRNA-associated Sm-like protein LSm4
MVNTKNGDSFHGLLAACDTFMNLHLTEVTITSPEGLFHECPSVFVRGNNIQTIQFEPEVLSRHGE